MGWYGGEWIEGRTCEDAPCCGCCGPEWTSGDSVRDDFDHDFWDDEEDDEEDDDQDQYAYAGHEDAGFEEALFGDA